MLLPVVVILAIVAASARALDSRNIDSWSLCQMSQLRQPARPSDLLVMGSSRTAAAFDVSTMTRSATAGGLSSERVVFTHGSELDRDLAFRTYVETRGVPKALGLELSFDRTHAEGYPMLASTRTQISFEPKVYWDLVGDLRHEGVPLADTYFWTRLQSTAGFAMDRADAGVQVALRDPGAVVRARQSCHNYNAGYFDNYGEARRGTDLKPLSPRNARIFRGMTASLGRYNLQSAWAKKELLLMRDLIDLAHRQGVKQVFLYYLPNYGEASDVIDLAAVQKFFPDTKIFDARTITDNPSQPLMHEQFDSPGHVNTIGAYEIGEAFLATVKKALR